METNFFSCECKILPQKIEILQGKIQSEIVSFSTFFMEIGIKYAWKLLTLELTTYEFSKENHNEMKYKDPTMALNVSNIELNIKMP